MKRILLVAVSSSALVLTAPGIAAAHHHHAKRHHRHTHHARVRVLDFRASKPATPASPTTPTSAETAGTVTSFEKGVLKITLTDGTVVSGQVTEKTEIHCKSSTPATDDDADDHAGSEGLGDQHASAQGQAHGQSVEAAHEASDGEHGQQGSDDEQQNCTSAALVAGALVREAELSISSAGAVWKQVDLA